ncbi:ribosomal protein S1 [Hamiltosporidium magnivora]|uniref:Small ribosomal subunit protein eS1 n=3 Tax=Hamiltosporidium TaxID=1176354 RepID=A0A4Q9KRB2_9MICR|nr:ribosomal protein S1 [Hamiltosporidium magnivora]
MVRKKGAKKGSKKKVTETFTKKDWIDLKLPNTFVTRVAGKALVTRSLGKQNVEQDLVGKMFCVNQSDLCPDNEENSFRKFKFVIDSVKGKDAISTFNGMEITSDKHKGIIRKWHTLIEGYLDIKTKDNFYLRVFMIAVTKRRSDSLKKTSYAHSSQVRQIRKIMFEVIKEEIEDCDISKITKKLMNEKIGKEVEKRSGVIIPIQNCHVRKVKVIKRIKSAEEEIEEE